VNFKEIGWESKDWIHPAQDRNTMAGCCEHGESSGSVKGEEFFD
jgi:hypothetical protein